MKYYNYGAAEKAAVAGATHRVTIKYTDLTGTAGLVQTSQLFPQTAGDTLPAGTFMEVVAVQVSTAFAGPSVSALTMIVGDGNVTNRLCTATYGDLLTATTRAIPAAVTTQPFAFAAADGIDAVFTAVGANLSVLTAGQVDVYFKIIPAAGFEPGL